MIHSFNSVCLGVILKGFHQIVSSHQNNKPIDLLRLMSQWFCPLRRGKNYMLLTHCWC